MRLGVIGVTTVRAVHRGERARSAAPPGDAVASARVRTTPRPRRARGTPLAPPYATKQTSPSRGGARRRD